MLTLVRMQGEEGDPDYLVWEHSLAMNGVEDLIMGKNGKSGRHSYLSKAIRMEGGQAMVYNKAHYSGWKLSTATAVPGGC